MEIIVLDTIHGGADLANGLASAGHHVDMVDVYRGEQGISPAEAARRTYDLLVAPVHLDPDHPLLSSIQAPRITHHAAVRMLLAGRVPRPMIEVTGAWGKTTTAHAIAHALGGKGVLHSTPGTFACPERKALWKRSITPASVLPAAAEAVKIGGWLVAEESLGVSGAGDVAVLTSGEDYRIAAGKRSALEAKLGSMRDVPTVVVPPGVRFGHPGLVDAGEVVSWDGDRCTFDLNGIRGQYRNILGSLAEYRASLTLATATLCALGADPSGLGSFRGVEGRLSVEERDGVFIVDNSNSGTSAGTTEAAAAYARSLAAGGTLTLVIGEEDRTVCEGFPPEAIASSIRKIHPDRLVLVGERGRSVRPGGFGNRVAYADTLEAARTLVLRDSGKTGAVVLSVKTWR
jgi:UDP-N-acetylmuramyl pentapeptide synthase